MFLTALLIGAAQVTAPQPGVASAPAVSPAACNSLMALGADRARDKAEQWRLAGGGYRARQCVAMIDTASKHYDAAAEEFAGAAGEADSLDDAAAAASIWAQAGNAWLLAGDPGQARSALTSGIGTGALSGDALAQARLDRARADVQLSDEASARTDLDDAVKAAPDNATGWMLSAALARRTGDLARARTDISHAITYGYRDPAVQLEAGNIAAASGNADLARHAWQKVVDLAPDSAQAKSAAVALRQFGDDSDTGADADARGGDSGNPSH